MSSAHVQDSLSRLHTRSGVPGPWETQENDNWRKLTLPDGEAHDGYDCRVPTEHQIPTRLDAQQFQTKHEIKWSAWPVQELTRILHQPVNNAAIVL